ncbi:hypothetical protein T10_7872 [Trichinella papuae]|uniref:Uncharacterized protein n=1 Tax=Trichinella papuae TaxID=268474 RepID=A0A0V1M443_9BILA|nr:hypothetical protein T10_7872 [Trichinella papuae]
MNWRRTEARLAPQVRRPLFFTPDTLDGKKLFWDWIVHFEACSQLKPETERHTETCSYADDGGSVMILRKGGHIARDCCQLLISRESENLCSCEAIVISAIERLLVVMNGAFNAQFEFIVDTGTG